MLIIPEKWFQLGNRLFAMSHFIASARENGFTVANPAFEDYAEHFTTTAADLWCRYPPRRSWFPRARWLPRALQWPCVTLSHNIQRFHLSTRLVRAIRVGMFDEYSLDSDEFRGWVKKTCFLLAHGWSFRDPAAFHRQADAIRVYFTPLPELRARVTTAIARARQNCDLLVGVHIRQGDYKVHLDGKYYYETAQYVAFMRQVAALHPGKKVGFLICSNAPQPPELFAPFTWLPGDGHLVVDLYSLAQCDLLMGPPSTYSQWASFYGNVPLAILNDGNTPLTASQFEVFTAYMSQTQKPT